MARRNEESMERLVVEGRMEGKRSRDRSPIRCSNLITSMTQSTMTNCSQNATKQERWQRIARAAIHLDLIITITTLPRVTDQQEE